MTCLDVNRFLVETRDQFGPVFALRLDDVLEALGTRSSRVSAALRTVCESVLHEMSSGGGAVGFSFHSGGYVVFRLPGMDEDRARRRASEIANRIGERVLGDGYLRVDFDQPRGIRSTLAEDEIKAAIRRDLAETVGPDWRPVRELPASIVVETGLEDAPVTEGSAGVWEPTEDWFVVGKTRRIAGLPAADVTPDGAARRQARIRALEQALFDSGAQVKETAKPARRRTGLSGG